MREDSGIIVYESREFGEKRLKIKGTDENLEFRLRKNKKAKFLRNIKKLEDAVPSGHPEVAYHGHPTIQEALKECAIFYFASVSPDTAAGMLNTFLDMANEQVLSETINSLFTGTGFRKSTDYHKGLYLAITGFAVDQGLGEFVGMDPLTDMFNKARTMQKQPAQPRTTSGAYKR